jgi:hypothetical protein
MRSYSSEEARLIAEACEAYLFAHSRRNPAARSMTHNEHRALTELRYAIAAREREALKAEIGEAV